MENDNSRLIETNDMPLARWLKLLSDPPDGVVFVDYKLPSDEHLQEYAETVGERSEEEVGFLLLELLVPSTSIGCDERRLVDLYTAMKKNSDRFEAMIKLQYYRRLVLYSMGRSRRPPREGITWVMVPLTPESKLRLCARLGSRKLEVRFKRVAVG